MAQEQGSQVDAALSMEQTMARLSLSRAEIYKMVGAGTLAGEKIDHRLHFAEADVARVAAELAATRDGLLAEASRALDAFEPVPPAPDADTVEAEPAEATEEPVADAGKLIADLGARVLAEAVRDGIEAIYVDPVVDGDRLLFSRRGRRRERARWPVDLSRKMKEWLRSQAPTTVRRGVAEGMGRIETAAGTRQLILTVVPTRMGEHVHLRLITEPPATDLVPIGYEPQQEGTVDRWLSSGSGLLLLTDAADAWSQEHRQRLAQRLVDAGRLVASVEHRLQYRSPDLVQFDVDDEAEEAPDFAQLWRSLLAMDPDVIFVDELRTAEEARLVIDAAGGALVIAQMMAGNAVAGLRHLMAGSLPLEALTAHLLGAIERLTVRRLCSHCRQPASDSAAPFSAAGCDACKGGDAGHQAVVGLVSGADLSAWLRQETPQVDGGQLGAAAALQRAVAAGTAYVPHS